MSIVFLQTHFAEMVEEMQASQHHYDWENLSPHHLEGDVWSHQMMVSGQCRDHQYDKFVEVAAICHDLGKPACRDVQHDTKRVRFSGHSGVGVFMAAEVLKKMQSEHFIDWPGTAGRRHVMELVSWHQDWFSELTEDGYLEPKVMARFAGQSHKQIKNLLEIMIDNGNVRITTTYRTINEDKLIFKHNQEHVAFNEARQTRMENVHMGNRKLHILIGPPLSGKSTWQKENFPEASVVSRDDTLMTFFPEGTSYSDAWAKVDQKEVDHVLQAKWQFSKREWDGDIVVDMTNMSRKSRRKWLNGIPRDMEKCAVVFATPLNELINRNINRKMQENKWIPEEVIMSMLKKFSAPTLDEFDTVDWVL